MSGICLAIDTDRMFAINELIRTDLGTQQQLDILNESVAGSGLITTHGYEVIKRSIAAKEQGTLLHTTNAENRQNLCELALIKLDMWNNKNELKVYIKPHVFHVDLNALIQQFSAEWSPYSGITFQFVSTLPADIIIELNCNGWHSSQIGRQAIPFSNAGNTTMHLGIGSAIIPEHIRRPVIHEFGHALGCIHEHQSPAASIQWDEKTVIRSFALGGWNEAKVRENVFDKYTAGKITNSEFDPNSIMIYPINKSFTSNGFSSNWNTNLSKLDKSFIRKAYSII